MYRTIEIPVGHKNHTGKDNFPETHVYHNYDRVQVCTGPKAKINAKSYIGEHAWFVKQNEHGLGDIPVAA